MILQNFIFPREDICSEPELYYHWQEGSPLLGEGFIGLEKGDGLSFCSYFNSFSAGKWAYYTNIQDIRAVLELSGKCNILLWHVWLEGGEEKKELVSDEPVDFHGRETYTGSFSKSPASGIYYVEIQAESGVRIYGGGYHGTPCMPPREINLALGICTYRREEYVRRTVGLVRSAFAGGKSPLSGHLSVFISDNADTLKREGPGGGFVYLFPNKNAGGSGGFSRCMLEAFRKKEELALTHIILMDDDVTVHPEVLFRTYVFLQNIKERYVSYYLGGALLRQDIPYIQHANGERWMAGVKQFTKRGYDLRKPEVLLKNEELLPVDYCGWWYCCIPLGEKLRSSFPLPFFIHYDDIEFGLRQGGRFITVNGIAVWHNAFDNRRPSFLEYYETRNELICHALHNSGGKGKGIGKRLCSHMAAQMLRYRYEDQRLVLKGVEDFLKGPGFLMEEDPVCLHGEVGKMGYAFTDVGEWLEREGYGHLPAPVAGEHLYKEETFSLRQKISLNGWLLPAVRKCCPVRMGAHPAEWYRKGQVLLYDPDTKMGFFSKRERRQVFVTLWRCLRLCRMLSSGYERAAAEYRRNWETLTSQEFWEKYLDGGMA